MIWPGSKPQHPAQSRPVLYSDHYISQYFSAGALIMNFTGDTHKTAIWRSPNLWTNANPAGILICYATSGLIVIVISRVEKFAGFSFVFPPNKYSFNLHLLTSLFCPTSWVILKQLDPSPSRATGLIVKYAEGCLHFLLFLLVIFL